MTKLWCKVPFVGLYVCPSGDVVLCCMSQQHSLGHINDIDDLEKFYNSKVLDYYRNSLNDGKILDLYPCKKCVLQEQLGNQTFKTTIEEHYKFKYEYEDAKGREFELSSPIRYLEYTLGNLCNADCATCSSFYSHKWQKLDKLFGREVYPMQKLDDSAVSKIENVLYGLEYLEIKGGEPFADIRNIRILNKLLEVNSKCNVNIVSNMHTITPEAMGILKRLPNLNIYASVDGVGKVYDWIRGGVFNKTIETIERYHYETGRKVQISVTISLYNYFHLEQIYDYFKDKEYISEIVFYNWVIEPKYSCCDLLPEDIFDKRMSELEKSDLHFNSKKRITLDEKYNKELFFVEMEKMNEHRGFDLRDYVPELKQWFYKY